MEYASVCILPLERNATSRKNKKQVPPDGHHLSEEELRFVETVAAYLPSGCNEHSLMFHHVSSSFAIKHSSSEQTQDGV